MGRAHPDLVDLVGALIDAGPKDRPPRIAVVGAQGSGKTTLAREAADRFGAAQISIDDVYLTRAEREAMAREVHPLFLTRGPPGTHDLGLLQGLIDSLSTAGPDDETAIPDFDKRGDDRWPADRWRRFRGRPSAVLIDAWCLGAQPEDAAALAVPVNDLERERDPDGRWRRAVDGGFERTPPRVIEARASAVSLGNPGRSDISLGQRVFHAKFGYGHVAEIEGNKLEIDFEHGSRKRVLDSFVTIA